MSSPVNKPKQRDIARAANVSQSTVSFVLTNRSVEKHISLETQQRVHEAARQLSYSPNVAAQSLRGGRTGLIGVHTYERIFPATPEHYYHQFLVGMEEEASSLGLDLVLFTSAHKSTTERSVFREGHNRMRLADGAVILGARKDDTELRRLSDEGFPIVSIGRVAASDLQVAAVAADYHSVAAQTVAQYHALGHQRLLYVGHEDRLTARQDRHDGYRRGCTEFGIAEAAPAFLDPSLIDADWLQSVYASGITGIVAETAAHAQAVYSSASNAGTPIPEAISLVCLDVSPNPRSYVPWSHIIVPRYEMGRRSLRLLSEILAGEQASDSLVALACTPAETTTLAPPASPTP
jgi:DNA-binding LacI/PurR family transcriptional regulator